MPAGAETSQEATLRAAGLGERPGAGLGGGASWLAPCLSVCGAFLKYKEGTQATSVPVKYFQR